MCQLSQGVSPVHSRQTPFDGKAFAFTMLNVYRVKWVNVLNAEDLVSLNPNMSVIIINGFTTVAVVMSYQHLPLNFQTRLALRYIYTIVHVYIECVCTQQYKHRPSGWHVQTSIDGKWTNTSKCTDKCQIHSIG